MIGVETFVERLITTGPVLIFRRGPGEVATYISPNVGRILGYAPEDVVDVSDFWSTHIHPDDLEHFRAAAESAWQTKAAELERTYRFLHKDGAYRWLQTTVQFEYDGADTPASIVGYALDADRQRLKQVLLNLIANAVKYNHEGGSVRLSCSTEGERLRLSVADTGPGIPADQMDRLFIPFERLGTEPSSVEGTGIGLALSKRLVELMGGEIGAESAVGAGSTFWVEFALAQDLLETESDTGASVAQSGSAGQRTVLYIEDNLSNMRLVERIMHGPTAARAAARGDAGRAWHRARTRASTRPRLARRPSTGHARRGSPATAARASGDGPDPRRCYQRRGDRTKDRTLSGRRRARLPHEAAGRRAVPPDAR